MKDMMADSFPGLASCSGTAGFKFLPFFNIDFFNTDFVAWIVTFYQLMLVVTGVMHEADSAYSIRSTWLCYRLVQFLITAYIC